MTQAELVAELMNRGISKAVVENVLHGLADVAHTSLRIGDEVPLIGIGKLKVQATAARTGRNPKTGEEIEIPAGRRVKLSVSSALKDAIA